MPRPLLQATRALLAVLTLAALEIPTQSKAAQSQAGRQNEVMALLDRAVPAADWRALGDDAIPILMRVASDPAQREERRRSAIAALGHIGTPAAADRLRALALDAKAAPEYRGQAAIALAKVQGKAAVPDLAPLLAEAEGELCTALVQALSFLGGPDARDALEERLAREDRPDVRELLQKSLSRLQP